MAFNPALLGSNQTATGFNPSLLGSSQTTAPQTTTSVPTQPSQTQSIPQNKSVDMALGVDSSGSPSNMYSLWLKKSWDTKYDPVKYKSAQDKVLADYRGMLQKNVTDGTTSLGNLTTMITDIQAKAEKQKDPIAKDMYTDIAKVLQMKVAAQGPGWKKQLTDFVSTAGANAVSAVADIGGNVMKMTDYINPVSWMQKAWGVQDTIGSGLQKGANWVAEQPLKLQEMQGTNLSTGGKVGAPTGQGLGTVAGQVPALVGGSELLNAIKGLPEIKAVMGELGALGADAKAGFGANPLAVKIAKMLGFAGKSAGTTAIMTGTTEGRLPTAKEVGGYGLIDVATAGIANLGGAIYRSAFKGTAKVEKNMLNAFDKSVADVAEELGYVGSAGNIAGKAEKALGPLGQKLDDLVTSTGPVTRKQFIDTVTPALTQHFDDLPDSNIKDQAFATIKQFVEDYAPKKTATGKQLEAIIRNLNQGLFGAGSKLTMDVKTAKSLEQSLKVAVKELLPDEVKPVYEAYAKNKLIEGVMENKQIKDYLRKHGLAALGGTVIGASAGSASGDPWTIIRDAIVGGFVGGTVGNTALATYGGAGLKATAKPSIAVLIKDIVNKVVGSNPSKPE